MVSDQLVTLIWVNVFLNLLPLAVLGALSLLFQRINKMRDDNERNIMSRLDKIEVKLDEQLIDLRREINKHLSWHLGEPPK